MKSLFYVFLLLLRAINFFSGRAERKRARIELLDSLLGVIGFRLYNADAWWSTDEEFISAWQGYPEANKRVHDRRFNLFNLAKLVRDLEGDTAECGVYRGAGSYLILKSAFSLDSEHFIFDSFEGLSDPSDADVPESSGVVAWKQEDLSVPKNIVENNLQEFSKYIRYFRGWIPSRFDEVSHRKFRFVHVDVDLYEPTRESIEFFYSRLVKGGLLVCDDYGFRTCPGATRAMNEFFNDKPESIVHITSGTGFIVKS